MSINPVSDIVLDVARAADPNRSLAAAERLARLGAARTPAQEFASLATPREAGADELRGQLVAMTGGPGIAPAAPMNDQTKAYKGIEELLLQRLVEAMLPKESSGLFGSGAAGDVWRSMLAEQLAKQIGKTVDLGLAKTAGETHVAAASASTLANPLVGSRI